MPGDRIEHGAVIPLELVPGLPRPGPHRGDPAGTSSASGATTTWRDVDADDRDDLWRCGSLLDAGVPVGGSSDAPYGPLDPWAAVVAAVERPRPAAGALGPDEAVGAGHGPRPLPHVVPDPGGEPAGSCRAPGRPLPARPAAGRWRSARPDEVSVLATTWPAASGPTAAAERPIRVRPRRRLDM